MVDDIEYQATHTTPDSITINHYLGDGFCSVDYCFMEVKFSWYSQQKEQKHYICWWSFTNLSHDHLDYHPTFAEYRDVKKSFFDHLPKSAFALTNADDKNGALCSKIQLQKTHLCIKIIC
jgi:UDP-N-acetylmuramoyl-L-alanyl-D-glutamate--2,6-diaminopimelate ligase